MGRVAEHLRAMTVRAVSPDGRVCAEAVGRRGLRLSFDEPEDYMAYAEESELAEQLRALLQGVRNAQLQGERAVYEQVAGLRVDDAEHWNADHRRFAAERDDCLVKGASLDGIVELQCVGMRREWAVRIAPGAFDDLAGEELLGLAEQAMSDLWEDWSCLLYAIKTEIYGKVGAGLPDRG